MHWFRPEAFPGQMCLIYNFSETKLILLKSDLIYYFDAYVLCSVFGWGFYVRYIVKSLYRVDVREVGNEVDVREVG